MEHKASFLRLFLLFLGFSLLISTVAVPYSRSLKTITGNPTLQESHDKVLNKEVEKKRKLLVERDDYDGTGANNRHDPSPPSPGGD